MLTLYRELKGRIFAIRNSSNLVVRSPPQLANICFSFFSGNRNEKCVVFCEKVIEDGWKISEVKTHQVSPVVK